jgi:dienelactone hydrolase
MGDAMKVFLWTAAAVMVLASSALAQPPQMPKPTISDPGPTGVQVDQGGVFANYFAAKGPGRHAGVLLLGGSEGGLGPGALRQALALQAHGFNVLQLAYFGAPGTPEHLVDVPLETFGKGLAWLQAQPGVDPARIGVVGGSKGAEAALLVASREPAIKAVVVGMPSSVVWPGISYTPQMQSSWTVGGAPLPFLPYAFGSDYRDIYGAYAGGLKALGQHPDAVIPVERIDGPVMLICGKADTLWPSCPMAEQVAARLKAKGFKPRVELLEYADAGHALFGVPLDKSNPAYPTLASLGGSADGNNAARMDNWPRTLAFLDQALAAD